MGLSRPLKVVLYAAFIGLLLAATLQADLEKMEKDNAAKKRLTEELETAAGVERAARERYGMIKPGEKVYIVPDERQTEH